MAQPVGGFSQGNSFVDHERAEARNGGVNWPAVRRVKDDAGWILWVPAAIAARLLPLDVVHPQAAIRSCPTCIRRVVASRAVVCAVPLNEPGPADRGTDM